MFTVASARNHESVAQTQSVTLQVALMLITYGLNVIEVTMVIDDFCLFECPALDEAQQVWAYKTLDR